MNIIDKIKTFEDACEVLEIYPTDLPTLNQLSQEEQKAMLAHYKLCIINKALNEGWKADYSNSENKYYPWFWFNKAFGSSGAFVFVVYDYGNSGSGIGSRLVFKSRELAEYASKQFIEIYREYFTYNK